MNLTIDQFMRGLERSVRELPKLFAEWDEVDDDLRGEYTQQLLWMLHARREVTIMAHEHKRLYEIADRIAQANAEMLRQRAGLEELMGIQTDLIVQDAVISAAPQDSLVASDNRRCAIAA